jgi:general L-amino acid transport system permease protein
MNIWKSRRTRALLWQAVAVLGVVLLLAWLGVNTVQNLRARGIPSGFDFLLEPAGFDIGETVLSYDPDHPYWQAYLAGLLNTLRVALLGCLLATVLGTAVGVGRLAHHPLLRGLCGAYVEVFRNIPLLLQLLLGYLLLAQELPAIGEARSLGPLALDKNGLAWRLGSEGDTLFTLTPEFLAVLLGLVLYTAAFVAEVVRAGLQAVPSGQAEAAAALGLSRGQALRRVLLPQALRVIVPPLSNQYLNLTKNSSLAVAIGYPELVSIANTAINQTGRALECIALIMAVYLSLSLATSLLMNRFNARVAIRER